MSRGRGAQVSMVAGGGESLGPRQVRLTHGPRPQWHGAEEEAVSHSQEVREGRAMGTGGTAMCVEGEDKERKFQKEPGPRRFRVPSGLGPHGA